MTPRLAVLVSGTGSLLEAMIKSDLPIDLVLADRPCRGFDEVALQAKLPRAMVLRGKIRTSHERHEYTSAVCQTLKDYGIELVAMAGFMTILGRRMMVEYDNRVLNAHPSLLPAFRGEHAVRDALEYGVKVTGTTIHIATDELDDGPILAQQAVEVLDTDTLETLHERIKEVERVLYPQVIREYGTRSLFARAA